MKNNPNITSLEDILDIKCGSFGTEAQEFAHYTYCYYNALAKKRCPYP